jgi:hypothetical protein
MRSSVADSRSAARLRFAGPAPTPMVWKEGSAHLAADALAAEIVVVATAGFTLRR